MNKLFFFSNLLKIYNKYECFNYRRLKLVLIFNKIYKIFN